MVSITKSTLCSSIYENFYDILATITSVTLKDNSTVTIQTYTSAFPDKDIDDGKLDYPIMIINSPNLSWTEFTFTKKWVEGTIAIDIFTTKAEAGDKFIDAINDKIETSRKTLRDLGLLFVNLESTTKDEFFRGKVKVHVKSATFKFKFVFTKTRTY